MYLAFFVECQNSDSEYEDLICMRDVLRNVVDLMPMVSASRIVEGHDVAEMLDILDRRWEKEDGTAN